MPISCLSFPKMNPRHLVAVLGLAAQLPLVALEEKPSYLENDRIRLGVDLSIGGAITWLSEKEEGVNLINSHDWGRQIQMSFYSGPNPFEPDGKKPHPHWKGLGWNPIQSGDWAGNPSKILEHRNDGEEIYVKCIPMQWPLDGVPGDCVFESWIRLEGRVAKVRSRITNQRKDKTQYPPKSQELPALYTNGPWYKLVTYTGLNPYQNESVVEIPIKEKKPGDFPWSRFTATEHWAALLNEKGRGVGVWTPRAFSFLGGFSGKPGAGGPKDGPTGYIAPLIDEILDHDIRYEFSYHLIVGTVDDIRGHVYRQERQSALVFEFEKNREHWIYQNATDGGLPIKGVLEVRLERPNARLRSAEGLWVAAEHPAVEITAAFHTDVPKAVLFWENHGDRTPDEKKHSHAEFDVIPDGEMRTYRIPLEGVKGYTGHIQRFVIAPQVKSRPDARLVLDRFRIVKSGKGP
jgi:hypothetical protein